MILYFTCFNLWTGLEMVEGRLRRGVKAMSIPSSETKDVFFTLSSEEGSTNLTFFLDLDLLDALGDLPDFNGGDSSNPFWRVDLVTLRPGTDNSNTLEAITF